MDCYRILGRPGGTENKLAEIYADQVLLLGTDATGTELSPMRNAEAPINLGVIAARQDLERALDRGQRAIAGLPLQCTACSWFPAS
jgi:hypothetical protein